MSGALWNHGSRDTAKELPPTIVGLLPAGRAFITLDVIDHSIFFVLLSMTCIAQLALAVDNVESSVGNKIENTSSPRWTEASCPA